MILPESRHRLEDGKRGIRRSSWGILNRLQAERGVEVSSAKLADASAEILDLVNRKLERPTCIRQFIAVLRCDKAYAH